MPLFTLDPLGNVSGLAFYSYDPNTVNTKIRERKGCKKICKSVKSDLLSKTIVKNGRVLTSGKYVRFTRL